jgi:hypothetical protein
MEAGPYLLRYAQEASWREDHSRGRSTLIPPSDSRDDIEDRYTRAAAIDRLRHLPKASVEEFLAGCNPRRPGIRQNGLAKTRNDSVRRAYARADYWVEEPKP